MFLSQFTFATFIFLFSFLNNLFSSHLLPVRFVDVLRGGWVVQDRSFVFFKGEAVCEFVWPMLPRGESQTAPSAISACRVQSIAVRYEGQVEFVAVEVSYKGTPSLACLLPELL